MRTIITRLPRFAPKSLLTRAATTNTPRAFTMSSTVYSVNSSAPSDKEPQAQENTPKAPLALPEAPFNATQLDMSNGGTTVSLDHLGPMVVNVDGTMSRISNWDKMAEIEKKATLRIIGKRNQQRLEALKQARAQAEGEAKEAKP